MRLKKFCAVLCVSGLLAGMVLPAGCAQETDKPHKNGDKLTIGFSMATLKEERWYLDRDNFITEAQKLDADVILDVAYDDAQEQIKQVKMMIDQGIDVLVIIPHDANSAAAAVALAKRAGIKVVSYDRLVLNANVDLYISFDNVKVGELEAQAMLKAVPKGNYVIVEGPATDYNSVMISQGIKAVLKPHIDNGEINVISDFATADWMADEAADGVNKLLQDGARINAVIAENDSLAGGVISTLSQHHLVPDVPVVGMDADLAACQRVVEGQQLMTVYKPIKLLAVAAVDFAVKLAHGQDIGVSGRMSDGKYSVPCTFITPEAVDKDNMVNAVIKDGFHPMSDVYLNIPKSSWPPQ
jgi:D-xylose transport system substrate-binding protein